MSEVLKNKGAIDEQLEIIDILVKYKKYDLAFESLSDLREKGEVLEEVYYKCAEIYEAKGLYERAIEDLRKLEMIKEDSREVKFKIATLYQKVGNIEKTNEYLESALNEGYDSEKIFFYKGLLFEDEMKIEESIYFYKLSLLKNKLYMAPKYRLFYIYRNLNLKEEIDEILDKMIKYNGDDYDGYTLKFSYKLSKGDFPEAFKVLELAKTVFGELEPLKLDFIKFYIACKKYEIALEIIDEIHEDNAYYGEFMIAKAKIFMINGEYKKALDILLNKEVYDKENTEFIYLITLLRFKNSNYEEIIEELKDCDLDLSVDYGKITEILKAYSYLNLNRQEEGLKSFKDFDEILRIQSLSNPYDLQILLYRLITLNELSDDEKLEVVKSGLFKLDKERFENIILEIDKLRVLRMQREQGTINIEIHKNIITEIIK